MIDGFKHSLKYFIAGLRPEPQLWIDEWSEKYAYIPRGNGPEPGKYNLKRTPYAREILRALSPNTQYNIVVVKGCSQILKTQIALNWVGAIIDSKPNNILALMPDGNLAKRLSDRISKTIECTPKIVDKVAKPRSRDKRNTINTKEFDGGKIIIATAGSDNTVTEISVPYIICDEINRIQDTKEGSILPRALARASTFGENWKAYLVSSPTHTGACEISEWYARGTQCVVDVPCPHCGVYHELVQENLRWTVEDNIVIDAYMECPNCNGEIREHHKTEMLSRYVYRQNSKGDGRTISFHISAFYSPIGWFSWKSMAVEYVAAKDMMSKNDMSAMQVYVNIRLALSFDAGASNASATALQERAEPYRLRTVPAGGCILTCAVDVQGNRLEAMIIAWGRNGEAWVVDYHVINSSPIEQSTWAELDNYINTPLQHEYGGELKIKTTLIDTGYLNQEVYNFARGRRRNNVLAIKGASRAGKPVISNRPNRQDVNMKGNVEKKGVELWTIGTDTAKEYLWSRWHLKSGAGAIHFSSYLNDDFFDGLTCEKRHVVMRRGKQEIQFINPPGARNEPLDLTVYNLAGAYFLGLHKYTNNNWVEAENKCIKLKDKEIKKEIKKDWTSLKKDW
jgi:phage terminase large subunit GpA-like protein